MYVTLRDVVVLVHLGYAVCMAINQHAQGGTIMARSAKTQSAVATGGVAITGSQYKELLDTRQLAMHGFAEGTVDAATKAAARTAVRNARKLINANEDGLSVAEWRQAEELREAELKAAQQPKVRTRKPRQPKPPVAETTTVGDEDQVEPENGPGSESDTDPTE